ncbi:MAG: hypothetical protein RI885_1898 [Actinomycetota bacterium]|jgi:hypothetical protein
MGIGTGIFLFVVGAIMAFALNFETTVIDLDLVGYILMGAGLVVFIISLFMTLRRRSSVTETRTAVDPNSGQQVTRSDRSDTL